MSEEVRMILQGLRFVLKLSIGQVRPEDRQDILVFHRNELEELSKRLSLTGSCVKGMHRLIELGYDHIIVRDLGEELIHPVFHVLYRVISRDAQLHNIGRIPFFVEIKKSLSDPLLLQTLLISTVKPIELAALVDNCSLNKRIETPCVALK